MKIERKDINTARKLLSQIKDFKAPVGDYEIIFPLDAQVKSIGGIELTVSNNKFGNEKLPEPGILFDGDSCLAYADYQFGRKIDFLDMMELVEYDVPKKVKEFLINIDCYLVHKQNILLKFKS